MISPACASSDTPILALYNVPPGKYSVPKQLSLNAVVIWPETSQLDEARQNGLRAIVNIPPAHFPDRAAWKKRVIELKSHPALFAWAPYDEPDLNRKPIPEVAATYNLLKSIDPDHPVYQAIWNPMRYADYAPYCDILVVVPYVVTRLEPLKENDYFRIHYSIALAQKIMGTKPVYTVIQAFAGHPAWPRPPSPGELSSMVAVAHAAGAAGFAFYAYTSAEPFPLPSSKTRFQLVNDTPLMEAIRSSSKLLLRK